MADVKGYLEFSSPSEFTLKFGFSGQKGWDGLMEYSTNLSDWIEWDSSLINSINGKLYLRGTGNTTVSNLGPTQTSFVFEGENISCIGRIDTLLDYQTVLDGGEPVMSHYCCARLFKGCTALVQAPELPATTLSDYCYESMFDGCVLLKASPKLPAITLKYMCYNGMFYGCTGLIQGSELPAVILEPGCYGSMYENCTSLVVAPKLLATTSKNSYGYMFYGCTSLTTISSLAMITLGPRECWSMFGDCTSLKISETQDDEYKYPIIFAPEGATPVGAWNRGMLSGTGGTFTGDPEIGVTYYTTHTHDEPTPPTTQQKLYYNGKPTKMYYNGKEAKIYYNGKLI